MKSDVAAAVRQAVKQTFKADVKPEVTYPEPKFGDFSTNVALRLASELDQAPQAVAGKIAAQLTAGDILSAEVAGPGFINITMKPDFWAAKANKINKQFAISSLGKGKKVQVEFISANPTGPLTLGNARGGFIGDVLSNVLQQAGFTVVREYYFNDAGTQISKLVESVKAEAGLIDVKERQYRGEYIQELAVEFKHQLDKQPEENLKKLLTQAIFERHIKPTVDQMGIKFDVWFNESDLISDGTFDQVMEKLRQQGLVEEKDGAVWLKTGAHGDTREARVLVKNTGEPTYLAADIAYHANIFAKRGFDLAIKELGPDHIAQFPSLLAAVRALYPGQELQMVGHQQLRLIREGREFKMSKRLGQYVTVQALLDEVGADVARFLMLMRDSSTHMDFDLKLAREQSQKNPYYYVMYAYARAHSILAEAAKQRLAPAAKLTGVSEPEKQLLKHLLKLPGLVEQIARTHEVHKLTFWGMETAKLFHDYYESERVISADRRQSAEKLLLIERFITVMDTYFDLMGLTPHAKM